MAYYQDFPKQVQKDVYISLVTFYILGFLRFQYISTIRSEGKAYVISVYQYCFHALPEDA